MSIPRYAPHRPLPAYRYRPGRAPHPTRDPDGHSYGMESEPSPEDYTFGVDLYNRGYFWEAHEAWEGLWREADDPARRAFLQGLILCAAAALKAREDRWDAAASLAGRARDRMATVGGPCLGLDGPVFASRVVAFVERREDGPPPIELTGR